MSIVEDTERAWFCPQTDRQMDGQTDKMKPVYPLFNFIEAEGIMMRYWECTLYHDTDVTPLLKSHTCWGWVIHICIIKLSHHWLK